MEGFKIATQFVEYFYKIKDKIFTGVSESTLLSSLLEFAEEKTGVPGSYLVTAITVAALLCVVVGFGPFILCDLLVIFYPAFRSYQALEQKDPESCRYWMKYWIVFGTFQAVVHIGDFLLWWLPGYGLAKFLFLICCFAPMKKNGSTIVYENYIRKIFQYNADTVDTVIRTVTSLSSLEPQQEE